MVNGKGRFRKRREVDGRLEISARGSIPDARLEQWMNESTVILPRLQMMVRSYGRTRGREAFLLALEDLGRRIERLEAAVARLSGERTR